MDPRTIDEIEESLWSHGQLWIGPDNSNPPRTWIWAGPQGENHEASEPVLCLSGLIPDNERMRARLEAE